MVKVHHRLQACLGDRTTNCVSGIAMTMEQGVGFFLAEEGFEDASACEGDG